MIFYVVVARPARRNYAADEQFYFPCAPRERMIGNAYTYTEWEWGERRTEREARVFETRTSLGTSKQIKFANRMKRGWDSYAGYRVLPYPPSGELSGQLR